MKKLLLLFMISCLTVTIYAQQLSYRIVNPRIIRTGTNIENLEFMIQVKADQPGTFAWGLQMNLTFNDALFSSTATHWVVTKQGAFNGFNTQSNPMYTVVRSITGTSPNRVFNLGLPGDVNVYTEEPNEFDLVEMPTTWTNLVSVRARFIWPINGDLLAGISFIQSSMNGTQSYLAAAEDIQNYLSPTILDSKNFMQSYCGRFYSQAYGWSQIGGPTNNAQFTNWDADVSTTVWDGTAAIAQVDNTAALIKNLNINTGATLTVAPKKYVTISENLVNNGNLIVNNDATGTASLLTAGTVSGSGTYNVNQHLTGSGAPAAPNGRMWYITSPVSGATSAVFDALSPSNKLWSYAEPTFAYTEITNNTTPLIVGDAYVARMGASGNVNFTGGAINSGVYSKNLSRTGNTNEKRGYHLVGNPYPSYLDWHLATKTNLNTTLWYRASNLGNTAMVFDTYNATSGLGTGNNGVLVSRYLPPMQGFWVKVEGDGNTGVLGFDNSMRSHQDNNFIKTNNGNNTVRLAIDNGSNSDQAVVNFNLLAGTGFNSWDSEKMFNNNALIPELYTKEAGTSLVINSMPEITNGMIVPLFMNIGSTGQHSITADLSDFDATTDIYLQDLMTAVTHDLRTGPYTFNSAVVSSNNRFNLLFTIITGSDNILPSTVTVYSFDQVLYVNTPSEGIIEVYDVLGKQVVKKESVAGMNEVQLYAKGVYVVRVVSKEEVFTTKITIW